MISPLLCLVVLPIAGAILMIAGTCTQHGGGGINAKLPGEPHHFRHVPTLTAGYQFVSSYPVVPSLGIHFTLGADGLSVAVLMSTAVTLAAVCVARTLRRTETGSMPVCS